MSRIALTLAALALIGMVRGESGDQPFRSGPKVGGRLPGAFHTLHVNGPHAGKMEQPICDLVTRPRPFTFVFARNASGSVVQLIKKLDVEAARTGDLATFVFFADEKEVDSLAARLKKLAERERISAAVLSIRSDLKTPPRWDIADDAEVTVIVFNHRREIVANFPFRKGELDGKAIDKIIAVLPQPKLSNEDVRDQIWGLLPANDQKTKLNALNWFHRHSKVKNVEQAIPALERCIRKDDDARVRERAVWVLSTIAEHQKKPCPLAIVEAMLDKDESVSQAADGLAGGFSKFEPGSIEVLLRYAKTDWGKQRAAVIHLARADGKDKRVLQAIQEQMKDKLFSVRHNAHCALFRANDDLEQFLRYLVHLQQDPEGVSGPLDKSTETGKRELATRNLALIGGAGIKVEWSEARADDLARALLKLLDDPSPLLRRGAAQDIGAMAAKVDLDDFVLPKPDVKNRPEAKEPPQKSQVALRLEKLNVEKRLRDLRDNDPDASVRAIARTALERWVRVFQK